jgi:hypothetical protein
MFEIGQFSMFYKSKNWGIFLKNGETKGDLLLLSYFTLFSHLTSFS